MGRLFWALLVLIIASFALTGCGGGGGGNGGGDPTDPPASLVGLWQPISATEDGDSVRVSSAMMKWDDDWSYGRIRFNQNGTCSIYGYKGDSVDLEEGTWSTDQGVAQVVFDGETTEITWSDIGNLMTATFTRNGHDYETKWVRVTNITKRDANMVKAWKVDSVIRNGIYEDLAHFFEWQPGSDQFVMQFHSNGELVLRELNGSDIVERKLVSWVCDKYVIRIYTEEGDDDLELWGYIGANSITVMDDGSTVTFELSAWSPAGYRDPHMVGSWRTVSATVDGIPTLLSEVFDWDPGITAFGMDLWEDGTCETAEFAGSAISEAWLSHWETNGNQLTLQTDIPMLGTYALSGSRTTLTVTYVQSGHTIAVKFNKVQ